MDTDYQKAELQRLKWMGIAAAIFLVSGFASISEMRYAIWGRVMEATVVRVTQDVDKEKFTLHYQFAEGGAERKEQDTVPADWDVPKQGPLYIQYIPGSQSSRINGHTHFWLVYVFLAASAALGGAVFWLCRQANQPIKRSSARRR